MVSSSWSKRPANIESRLDKRLYAGRLRRFSVVSISEPAGLMYLALLLLSGSALAGGVGVWLGWIPSFGPTPRVTIRVASKQFAESVLLAELLAVVIEENHGDKFDVERKFGYGVNIECFYGVQAGQIDLNPDYTGTILANNMRLSKDEVQRDKLHVDMERLAERLGKWEPADRVLPLFRFGFENSYVMTVSRETATVMRDALELPESASLTLDHLVEYSQIAEKYETYPGVSLLVSPEFMSRPDGHPGFGEKDGADGRGLVFENAKTTDHGPEKYRSLKKLGAVTDAYQTDAELRLNNGDGRYVEFGNSFKGDRYFPRYEAIAVANREFASRYPEIVTSVRMLENSIHPEQMAQMIRNATKLIEGALKESGLGDADLERPLAAEKLNNKQYAAIRETLRTWAVEVVKGKEGAP